MQQFFDILASSLRALPVDASMGEALEVLLESLSDDDGQEETQMWQERWRGLDRWCDEVLDSALKERLLDDIWGELDSQARAAVASGYRRFLVHEGLDVRQLEQTLELRHGALSAWCSGVSERIPVGNILCSIPDVFADLFHGVRCVLWRQAHWPVETWLKLHALTCGFMEGKSIASIMRMVPLGRHVLRRIDRGLDEEDRLFKDYFLHAMIIEVFEDTQEDESSTTQDEDISEIPTPSGRNGFPGIRQRILDRVVAILDVIDEGVLSREEEVTLIYKGGEVHVWAGPLYLTCGARCPVPAEVLSGELMNG